MLIYKVSENQQERLFITLDIAAAPQYVFFLFQFDLTQYDLTQGQDKDKLEVVVPLTLIRL